MPNLKTRIETFAKLGKELKNFLSEDDYLSCENENPWFTKSNVDYALYSLSKMLEKNSLEKWVNKYPKIEKPELPKKIGVITAGNIPLVGFHDMMCVLISGNEFHAKISSKDDFLFSKVLERIIEIEPEFRRFIHISNSLLKGMDAYIATGSNNSATHFEYYFKGIPHIIRKNRNSAAILSGDENAECLEKLADDIFLFYGLGCRSVSKLYVPEGYDFKKFIETATKYSYVINHHKYCNNYDYYKSIFLVNQYDFLDTEFCLLKESTELASPVSVIYYEYYKDFCKLTEDLKARCDELQVVVGSNIKGFDTVDFGKAQQPEIDDYSDGVDTMDFLTRLKT